VVTRAGLDAVTKIKYFFNAPASKGIPVAHVVITLIVLPQLHRETTLSTNLV
jgi:hypothetical protein